MHEPRNVLAASANAADGYARSSTTIDLSTFDDFPEPGMEPDAPGVDVPGVGCVPPAHEAIKANLPQLLRAESAHNLAAAADKTTPEERKPGRQQQLASLRRLLHGTLTDKLAAEGIRLAEANIVVRPRRFTSRYFRNCCECDRSADTSSTIVHAAWCHTGHVLQLARELEQANYESAKPKIQEDTATGGESRVADGEAARGDEWILVSYEVGSRPQRAVIKNSRNTIEISDADQQPQFLDLIRGLVAALNGAPEGGAR